jgi:hypothetical protein
MLLVLWMLEYVPCSGGFGAIQFYPKIDPTGKDGGVPRASDPL